MSRKSEDIIVAWVGRTDIDCMNAWRLARGMAPTDPFFEPGKLTGEEKKGHNGPIRTLTDELEAAHVYLLASAEYAGHALFVRNWVQRGTRARCQVVETGVRNPSSYEEVYEACEAFFRRYWRPGIAGLFNFDLTPGTPAMQAVMLCLSQIRYAGGRAWTTVAPRYAVDGRQHFEVRLPFRLPVEALSSSGRADMVDEALREEVLRVYAPVRAVNILLLGESGVGKTHFARQIHQACSPDGPFVELNCAELAGGDVNMFRAALFGAKKGSYSGAYRDTKGAFARAANGTLFLDEIGEIPLACQSVLLRAIQEKEVEPVGGEGVKVPVENVRIVSATNRDLLEEVRRGRFREDLYYRVAMLPVSLPPLREVLAEDRTRFRRLVETVLAEIGEETKDLGGEPALNREARDALCFHSWPGNIRELRHVLLLARVGARGRGSDLVTAADIERHLHRFDTPGYRGAGVAGSRERETEPVATNASPMAKELPPLGHLTLDEWLSQMRHAYIDQALRESGGNTARAAKSLGISYQQVLYDRRKKRRDERKPRDA